MARILGLDPNDPRVRAAMVICDRYGLDPLLKHVVVIPNSGAYITRDGLLHIAHRSGLLDGIEIVGQPEVDQRHKEWTCRVAVHRKDWAHPVVMPGRYPAAARYGPEMAITRAERAALKRAFDITDDDDIARWEQVTAVDSAEQLDER